MAMGWATTPSLDEVPPMKDRVGGDHEGWLAPSKQPVNVIILVERPSLLVT